MSLFKRVFVLIVFCSLGCTTTDDGNSTLHLGSMIGLVGMAVDGDDKDDYEKFFENEDCKCRH